MKENKKIKKVVFIGSDEFLFDLKNSLKNKNIEILLITNKDQNNVNSRGLKKLITNSIKNNSVKNFLNKNEVKKNNSIFISFSSRFLFSKKIIKELFFDNLFNIHCSRLPNDKGGGGYSWRIMRNDRIGNLCIHKISNEEIDAGLIYKFHKFVIDRKLIIPEDIHRETNVKLIKFTNTFIQDFFNKKKFSTYTSANYLGSYFPRLKTSISSWIDWNEDPTDIANFINAFDDPYSGAQSLINSKKVSRVRIKKAQLSAAEFNSNKLMRGLIYRHDENWINISLDSKFSLIVEDVRDFNNKKVLHLLKPGDHFKSSSKLLNSRNLKRIRFGPKGLIKD